MVDSSFVFLNREAKEYSMEDLSGYTDRAREIKEFDETKVGVKGLMDSGLTEIPRFFHHPPENPPKEEDVIHRNGTHLALKIPVIDLEGVHDNTERRKVIVEQVGRAAETWGFFQMVNHGIPVRVLDEIIQGVKLFHEQPVQVKKGMYSRDLAKKARFSTNVISGVRPLTWKDTLSCTFFDDELDPEEQLPSICRNILIEYVSNVIKLKETLSELLSEGLGLSPDILRNMGCMKAQSLFAHYYPECPQPDLTIGTMKHSDPHFLTILLQDNIGGLQFLHQHQWVDVLPVPGALLANIGDFLQLISNDKYKSVEHRVLAQRVGPRVSVATFSFPRAADLKIYGPIKLLLDDHLPVYKETTMVDYMDVYLSNGLNASSALPHFKL